MMTMAAPILTTMAMAFLTQTIDALPEDQREGVIAPIARPLFTEYLLAFELTSVVLLTAIVGAVVLGRRRQNAR